MKTKRVLAVAVLAVLCGGWLVWAAYRPARPRDYNVLVITLDTTRADRLGCYGYKGAETPALDSFADGAVRFTRAYSNVPLTLASHATMLTGLLPPEHGLRVNGRHSLRTDVPTLATVLADRGYQTAAFVASFVLDHRFGLNRGFQIYDDRMNPSPDKDSLWGAENPANVVADRALTWLDKQGDGPFFCWVHFYDPHRPYEPPEPFRSRLKDGYDGEIAFMDSQVRRVLDFIARRGLADRTIVVIAGDHGESFGEHREFGHGDLVYNSTMHVPLLVRAPGHAAKPEVVDSVVGLDEIPKTIFEILRVRGPAGLRGENLLNVSGERAAYGESESGLVEYGWAPLAAMTTARWKYIECPGPELYDLASDPGEEKNLLATQRETGERLRTSLAELKSGLRVASAPPAKLDDAALKALQELGYLKGMVRPPAVAPEKRRDPKAVIHVAHASDLAKELLTRADATRDSALYRQAAGLIEPLVKESPEFPMLYDHLARSYTGLGLFDKARKNIETALVIDPTNRAMVLNLGANLLQTGKPAEAVKVLKQGIRMPQDPAEPVTESGMSRIAVRTRMKLAEAFRLLGQPDLAAEQCNLLLKDDAANADAHGKLGNMANEAGRFDEAIAQYKAALKSEPNDAVSQSNLGVALARSGRLDQAITAYRRSLELGPKAADVHINLGDALLAAGQPDAAIRAYGGAAAAQPLYERAHAVLGDMLCERKRYAEAIAAWKNGAELVPGGVMLMYDLAWCYATCPDAEVRNGAEAVRWAEKLAGKAGKNAQALDALAAAYAEAGRFKEAQDAAREAARLARDGGAADFAAEIERRLRLYGDSKPFHQSR